MFGMFKSLMRVGTDVYVKTPIRGADLPQMMARAPVPPPPQPFPTTPVRDFRRAQPYVYGVVQVPLISSGAATGFLARQGLTKG